MNAASKKPKTPTCWFFFSDQAYYGETPVGLWRNERAVGDATPPITPKTAKNQKLPRNWLNGSELRDQHGRYSGVPPWSLRGTAVWELSVRARCELEGSAWSAG
jgi:hypothetical protein